MRAPTRIGLIQVDSAYNVGVADCHERLITLIEECLRAGADLVFAPEGYQYKGSDRSPRELAETHSANFRQQCAALSRRYRAYVAPWDYTIDGNGRVYNTTYILNRNGVEIGRYRKVHITHSEEARGISRGDGFPVFDLDIGRIGVMICFDNFYPESASILALQGAQLILYPLYADTLAGRWEIRTRARAIDNSVYIAPCHIHASPRESNASFTGLIAPDGAIVAQLREELSWRVVDIDLTDRLITRLNGAGRQYEYYKDYVAKLRNPAAYRPLTVPRATPDWDAIEFTR